MGTGARALGVGGSQAGGDHVEIVGVHDRGGRDRRHVRPPRRSPRQDEPHRGIHFFGQGQGDRGADGVARRDLEVEALDAARAERVAQGPHEERVHVGARRDGGAFPPVTGGLDGVASAESVIEQAQGQARPSRGRADARPGGQLVHRTQRLGNRDRQADARCGRAQTGLFEDAREHGDGEVEVVATGGEEGDERSAGRRVEEHRQHALGRVLHVGLERPRRARRDHVADRERHARDVVAGEEGADAVQPAPRGGLPGHPGAVEAQVEHRLVGGRVRQLDPEPLGPGVEHQAGEHVAQRSTRERHGGGGEHRGDGAAELQGAAYEPRQRGGRDLGEPVQRRGRGREALGAQHRVGGRGDERRPVRVGRQRGTARTRGRDGARTESGRERRRAGGEVGGERRTGGARVVRAHGASLNTGRAGPRRPAAQAQISLSPERRTLSGL